MSTPLDDPATKDADAPPEPPAAGGSGRRRDPTGARRFGFQLAGLPAVWLLLFLVLPLVMLVLWSFRPPGMASFTAAQTWTLETYRYNLGTPVFMLNLARTIGTVFVIALTAVALSYPVGYLLARIAQERRYLLLSLIIAPALVSYLLRLFAWRTLLGRGGVMNRTLLDLGLLQEPIGVFMYNRLAVIIVLTYVWIPFAALPIFARLEQLNPRLLEASADLGATRQRTFLRVTLPLSLPGVYASFFFVFIPTLGDFATAALVGGTTGRMFGNVIRGVVGTPDFPSAAVLSLMLFLVAAVAMYAAFRILRIKDVRQIG